MKVKLFSAQTDVFKSWSNKELVEDLLKSLKIKDISKFKVDKSIVSQIKDVPLEPFKIYAQMGGEKSDDSVTFIDLYKAHKAYNKKAENEEKEDSAEVTIGGTPWKFDDKAMSNLSVKDRQSIVEMIGKSGYLSVEPLPEANNKVKLVPGEEYTMSQFSKSLGKVGTDAA